MTEAIQFLDLLNGRVAYRKLGTGPKCLVAFHGFAEDGSAFLKALGNQRLEEYTSYLVDLPFHGQSTWADPVYAPEDLAHIVRRLVGKRPYDAVGHSLGGRLWISILPKLKHRPEQLILLAPDGIVSAWSGLIDHVPAGIRYKAARWLRKPSGFLRLASVLKGWGVIDRFALRYLQVQLATEVTRHRLFGTWQSMLAFKLGKHRAQQIIAGADFPVMVYLGAQDEIIPAKEVAETLDGLGHVKVKEVDCGHWNIIEQWKL